MDTHAIGEQSHSAGLPSPGEVKRARRRRRLKFTLPILVLLLLVVVTCSTNFIPSESMLPTLKPGDHIVTMRGWLAYPFGRAPARGDIIVFIVPEEGDPGSHTGMPPGFRAKLRSLVRKKGDILIKRVVGLPGETVQLSGREIYINDRKIPSPLPESDNSRFLATGYYGVMAPAKLGPDELFVMGDNSSNSDDSRYWGPLKRRDVLGRFLFVLYHEGANGPNVKRARQEGDE